MGAGALVVALLLTGPNVEFEWNEPAGGVVPNHYEVELMEETADPVTLTTDVPTITLDPTLGKDFEVRVRACLGATCGQWSELSQPISLNRSADFDGNGGVGIGDYLRFGQMITTQDLAGDLNGDAGVGIPDYGEFAEHYGACVGSVNIQGEELPAYVPCKSPRGRR